MAEIVFTTFSSEWGGDSVSIERNEECLYCNKPSPSELPSSYICRGCGSNMCSTCYSHLVPRTKHALKPYMEWSVIAEGRSLRLLGDDEPSVLCRNCLDKIWIKRSSVNIDYLFERE